MKGILLVDQGTEAIKFSNINLFFIFYDIWRFTVR